MPNYIIQGQPNCATDYAVNHLNLLNVVLDIVYPSHSESEAGMGSFTISSKQLPNSRWCDWWERVGLECTLIWRPQKCTLGPCTGLCIRPQAAECWQRRNHPCPQLTRGSRSPPSLGILLPSTKRRTGALYSPVVQAWVSALPLSV